MQATKVRIWLDKKEPKGQERLIIISIAISDPLMSVFNGIIIGREKSDEADVLAIERHAVASCRRNRRRKKCLSDPSLSALEQAKEGRLDESG